MTPPMDQAGLPEQIQIPMAEGELSSTTDNGKTSAVKKPPSRKSAKKRASRRIKNQADRSPPSPEALSSLAVQILALDPRGISSRQQLGLPVSEPKLDHRFLHALKRADLLVKMASGDTDEDIHAYQVFREGEELQTFDEIAERFDEAGWTKLTTRNSVEKCIDELVFHADQEIADRIDFGEQQLALQMRGPASLSDLRTRLRRAVHKALSRMALTQVLKDPLALADQVGQFLIERIGQQVSLDGPASRQEELESYAGYSSFEEFVLEPQSFRGFLGERSCPHLTPDLLQAAAFYFKTAATRKNKILPPPHEIADLHRTLKSSSVIPAEAIADMALLVESATKKDDAGQRDLAAKIALQLDAALIPWLKQEMLRQQVAEIRRRAVRTHPMTGDKAAQQAMLNKAFEALTAVISTRGSGAPVDTIGSAVDDVITICRGFREDLIEPLAALEDLLAHPPSPPKRSPKRLRAALAEFFHKTSPPRTERRIRPYEIFLFAAQKNLLPDKLVRRHRLLTAGFIPNPPQRSFLSVLAHHSGHPLNFTGGEAEAL